MKPEIVFDRSQAFLLFATFTGDVERVAAALGVRAIDVLRVADDEGWHEKLKPILELQKSARPGAIEQAINRAINYVQAHRLRMVIERIIAKLTGMNPDELHQYVFSGQTKDGVKFEKLTTRAIADLASAVEKCHVMSYMALNDSMPERAKRRDDGPEISSVDMNARIAEAMSKASKSKTPRAMMFDAQLEIAQSLTPAPAPETPVDPYDK